MSSTPSERALAARVAAHTRWSQTADRAAATAPARKGLQQRFEREVDPDGTLSPAERARRAQSARTAYFTRLSLRSAQSRRKGNALLAQAESADAELTQNGGAA